MDYFLKTTGRILMIFALVISSLAYSQADEDFDNLVLNGMASHWVLTQELYIGTLFLPEKENTPAAIRALNGKKRMEMRVSTSSWRQRSFRSTWLQLISVNNTPDAINNVANEIQQFTELVEGKLTYGDIIQVDLLPEKGVEVYINNVLLQKTPKTEFFGVLLNCWIGGTPPSSDFKRNILTRASGDNAADLALRYQLTVPEEGRKELINSWVVPSNIVGGISVAKTALATTKTAPSEVKNPVITQSPPETKTAAKPEPKVEEPIAEIKTAEATPPSAKEKSEEKVAETASTSKVEEAKQDTSSKPVVKEDSVQVAEKPKEVPAPTAKVEKVKEQKPEVKAEPIKTVETSSKKPVEETISAEEKAEDEKRNIKRLTDIYRARVLRQTYREISYPRRAISRNQEGSIVLKVTVNKKGELVEMDYEEKTPYSSLNKEAKDALSSAAPFDPLPEGIPSDTLEFTIPIRFQIPK